MATIDCARSPKVSASFAEVARAEEGNKNPDPKTGEPPSADYTPAHGVQNQFGDAVDI